MVPDEDLNAMAKDLANEIAGDFGAPAQKLAPPEKEHPAPEPKKEEEPAEEEKPAEGEGEKPGAEAPLDIDALFKDPKHAPSLQRRIDTAAAARARDIMAQERPRIIEEVKQELVGQTLEQHFASLSKDELAEELAADPQAAIAYAQVQARKAQVPQEEVQLAVTQVYASQVAVNLDLLNESDMPDAKKAELDPSKFTHLGVPGIREWGKAIQKALIEHESAKAYNAKLEADKQSNLADKDPDTRPDITPGRRTGPQRDLIATDSQVLLEDALTSKMQNPDKLPK